MAIYAPAQGVKGLTREGALERPSSYEPAETYSNLMSTKQSVSSLHLRNIHRSNSAQARRGSSYRLSQTGLSAYRNRQSVSPR